MGDTPQFIWNGFDLEDQRQIMDPPCDVAVASIFESGSMSHLASILKGMAKDDGFVSSDLPAAMHRFVQNELDFPFSSGDIALFEQTHKIWERDGMKFIFILLFRALPYTYMAEKPANVLRMTRLLETHTERRIFETAQFVFDVMDRYWWKPEKRGILTALKIRIMHSAMRKIILDSDKKGEKWDEKWGRPICQEDLIATNQVFSLEFFKGMSMLGETLSATDQEAWFHTWKTIGRIMGVEEALICKNVEEAWSLQHTVYAHLFKDETHSGILLAKRLVEAMDHFHMPEKLVLLLMKSMLADEQFPDCFERMLGPSYSVKYPELFIVPHSEEEKAGHKVLLRQHFHAQIKEYYSTMMDKKPEIKKSGKHPGFFGKLWALILNLLGMEKNGEHLIDIQLDKLYDILHDDDGKPVDELEEEMIVEVMSLMGGIMVSVLSIYFREGKETGFRIPQNLQENWALKG
jgi:hypothetical protein